MIVIIKPTNTYLPAPDTYFLYNSAMKSTEEMENFIYYLNEASDCSSNMDW
jgi:hypothetical protein